MIHNLLGKAAPLNLSLEVERKWNIWIEHRYPKMLRNSNARERDSIPCGLPPPHTVFDKEGGQWVDSLLQAHIRSTKGLRHLVYRHHKIFMKVIVCTGWWALLEFSCHFDVSYLAPCLGILTAHCHCCFTVFRLENPVFSTWNWRQEKLSVSQAPKLQTIWTRSRSRLIWGCRHLEEDAMACGGEGVMTELFLFKVIGLVWVGNGGSELELICLEKSMVEIRKGCHFQGELCAALGQGNHETKEHFLVPEQMFHYKHCWSLYT